MAEIEVQSEQRFNLRVEIDKSKIGELPRVYANYAEVRSNPEETYILLCLRMDNNVRFEGNEAVSRAEPFEILLMNTSHAVRLARSILAQVSAYIPVDGDVENGLADDIQERGA